MQEQRPIWTSEDQSVLTAWQEAVAHVAGSPKLRHQLLGQEHKLFPRFAEYYTKLRALPRRVRRAVQRKWKHTLAGVALLMALGGGSAAAATFNVPCPGGVGDNAALIQAINDSNDEVANPGADTINLVSNCTHTLTAVDNGTYGDTGLPVISSEITIDGNGSTIRRDRRSTPDFRIFAINEEGNLTLQETTVTGGAGEDIGGGGVANYGGTVTITNSTISGNRVSYGFGLGAGGGVFNELGTLTIINSTISDNSVSYGFGGGGVYNRSGTVTLTNSTISGNRGSFGGGLRNTSGTMTLTDSTVSGNTAALGGGLYNTSRTMTLARTVVSGNDAFDGPEIYNDGTLTANNFNLFGYDSDDGVSGFSPGATDIVPAVALSAILNTTLADNGGFTQTHALVSGSPAIDAVTTGCPPPATDQRGVTRPQGTRCDIGAFELESSPPTPSPSPTASPEPPAPSGDGGCSIAPVGATPQTPLHLLIPVFILIRRVWRRYRN